MIPAHLLYYCRGAGKVPVSSHIAYHDRPNSFTLLRYTASIIVSFLSAVLIIKAIYTVQKSYVNSDSDTIIMLHTSRHSIAHEKNIQPVKPDALKKNRAPEVKPELKPKVQAETVRQPEKTAVPETPEMPVINKPKVLPDVPLKKIDMAARKQWHSTVSAQDNLEMASLITKPEIALPARSVISSPNKPEKTAFFASRKAFSNASVPTPKVNKKSVKSYERVGVPAEVQKKIGLFSSSPKPAAEKTPVQAPGIYSPPHTLEGSKSDGFTPEHMPKASPAFSAEESSGNQALDIAGIDAPDRTLSSESDPAVRKEINKTPPLEINFNTPQKNDVTHIIDQPDIAGLAAAGNYKTMNHDHKKNGVYEGLTPGVTPSPAEDFTIKGVPLSKLPACRKAREETVITEQILNVIGSRLSCTDSTNRYLFSGTQRLSSFGMIIQSIGESRLSDRCGELHKAFQCLSVERN